MLRLLLAVPLLISACQKDETVSGYAQADAIYVLQDIDGVTFAPRATLTLPEQGVITGQAPCNSYLGKQTLPYPWFSVEALAVTKTACPELSDEVAFFAALQTMTLVETSGAILILSNDAGRAMVFQAQ